MQTGIKAIIVNLNNYGNFAPEYDSTQVTYFVKS